MSETAVERRLREMVEVNLWGEDAQQAIDAGREALALLREPLTAHGWRERRAALLARCEGEK